MKIIFVIASFFFLYLSLPVWVPTVVCAQAPVANTGGVSFMQCKFHRGDMHTVDESFQSPTLMRYFAEVSQKSGVPAALLAGIARVESPSSVAMTDDSLASFSCPTSPTGAKGLMQIQPPGTTGHDAAAINSGAKFINKTVNDISAAEYCDLETSIYLASGFVLKKLQYAGYGNGEAWDPAWSNNKDVINAVARGYYGCLRYPSCASGPHSYGDDLWISLQNCQNPNLTITGVSNQSVGGNQSVKSNRVCTKVGEPSTENPCGNDVGPGPVIPPGNFVHYCQNDPQWKSAVPGCTLSGSGCGPSSLAMALSTMGAQCGGEICTPTKVDALMAGSNHRLNDCNTVMRGGALSSDWLKKLGVIVGPNLVEGGFDYALAKKFVDEGNLIIGSSGNAPSCNCDHIFVIQDIDVANRDIVVRDPVCRNGVEVKYNYKNTGISYAFPVRMGARAKDAI